jgi:hypothetical protein
MMLLLREAMRVGRIAFHPKFLSCELGNDIAKRQLKDEISSFCVVTEPPKTTFGKVNKTLLKHGAILTLALIPVWQVRKTYTGKLYGKQDDLVIGLQLGLIGFQKFYQDVKYSSFRAADYNTARGFANFGPGI